MQNIHKLTDEQLVSAYAAGDNKAFDELLARHKQRLYTYILQYVHDSDSADDIFQETFVKAITTIKQGRYNDMGKFGAWLFRIARNLVIDGFRTGKSENTTPADSAPYDVFNRRELSDDTIEDMMIDAQIEEDVRRLIDYLPELQQEVLRMRFYEDLSFKEIADRTGVSINTSLGRMRYAIMNLRRIAKEKDLVLTR
ncbi:MAG: sigma-70 family RNA polymerase sigma factor [Bacteroidales bacterium]|nr:sigma-70 family RNA polymerase sigma factor [Bacteroidales bacterium]